MAHYGDSPYRPRRARRPRIGAGGPRGYLAPLIASVSPPAGIRGPVGVDTLPKVRPPAGARGPVGISPKRSKPPATRVTHRPDVMHGRPPVVKTTNTKITGKLPPKTTNKKTPP